MKVSKILFITTSSISTNPRLLKSYLFWRSEGYECKILAFRMSNWSDQLDDELIEKNQLNITNIPAAKQNYTFWLKASLVNRFLTYFNPSWLPIQYVAYASNKRSWQLIKYLKRIDFPFDHIEAHTLGALYPAYYWAKNERKTFTFDVEDYHPEEKIAFQPILEKHRRLRLMKQLLPKAKLITAASPLITEVTKKLVSKNVITINNSFSELDFKQPPTFFSNKKLQMVWFSQHISFGRGLEQFIEAAMEFSDELAITLIGNLNEEFNRKYIMPYKKLIQVLAPMNQEALHNKLSEFDIGLALEDVNADYNRNICLTNKIWAYFQSGLYILATQTLAQDEFITNNPKHGELISLEYSILKESLTNVLGSKIEIEKGKIVRYESAKELSFENEMYRIKNQLY